MVTWLQCFPAEPLFSDFPCSSCKLWLPFEYVCVSLWKSLCGGRVPGCIFGEIPPSEVVLLLANNGPGSCTQETLLSVPTSTLSVLTSKAPFYSLRLLPCLNASLFSSLQSHPQLASSTWRCVWGTQESVCLWPLLWLRMMLSTVQLNLAALSETDWLWASPFSLIPHIVTLTS